MQSALFALLIVLSGLTGYTSYDPVCSSEYIQYGNENKFILETGYKHTVKAISVDIDVFEGDGVTLITSIQANYAYVVSDGDAIDIVIQPSDTSVNYEFVILLCRELPQQPTPDPTKVPPNNSTIVLSFDEQSNADAARTIIALILVKLLVLALIHIPVSSYLIKIYDILFTSIFVLIDIFILFPLLVHQPGGSYAFVMLAFWFFFIFLDDILSFIKNLGNKT